MIIKLFKKKPLLILVASAIVTVVANQILNIANTHLTFFGWILYFVFGMYCSKYQPKEVNKKWLVIEGIAFLISSLFVVYTQYMSAKYKITFDYYASLFIVYSMLASLFFINKFKFLEKESKLHDAIINFFEPNTYLIFLYHVLFINIAQNDVITFGNSPIKKVFLTSFIVTVTLILLMCIVFNLLRKLYKSKIASK